MRRFVLLLGVIGVLISGCKKEETRLERNILACGHGGSGFQSYSNPYPSNSFGSVTRAIDGLGADGVEIDVQMSADRELFLYHNEELESMTTGTGCIAGLKGDVVLQSRYNRDFGVNQFSDEYVIKLETILSRYSSYTKKPVIYLDLRHTNRCDPSRTPNADTLAYEVVKMVRKYEGASWLYVISSSHELLNIIRKYDNTIRLYLDGGGSEAIQTADENNFDGIVSNNDHITREQVKQAHSKGMQVVLFNVKTREGTLDAVRKGPDAIQADNLELLLEILRE